MLASKDVRPAGQSVKSNVPAGTQSVPALEKALAIMEMLASSRNGLSLPDLVQNSGLPKSTVHCILVTLQRQDYLYRNERTGRYMFGMKLFTLANMAVSGMHLRELAAPYLLALTQRTRLTCHMAILEQDEVVLVAKVDGPSVFRLATWIGKQMDMHCTGLGKALIAHLPEARLDMLLHRRPLPRHNENTIASIKRLKEDLANTARRGYSIDDEEDEIGLRCIGAPVFNHAGDVIAAISIAGTTVQITSDNAHSLAGRVKDTAFAISRALGYEARFHSDESSRSTS